MNIDEEDNMKRVLTIQDISCVGRCSLTVALPILSVMGVEACPLPTALLSTHTAFAHFTFKDLTDEMVPIDEVWEKEGLVFDVMESGYLGSIRQIEIVRRIGQRLRKSSHRKTGFLQIVDPAMADHGKLYTGFTPEFVVAMADLCKDADLILPNLTEACLMTGMEYRPDGDEGYWSEVANALGDMGCRGVILTGYSPDKAHIGAYSLQVLDGGRRIVNTYANTRLADSFHGTGDIFASVVTGAMARGLELETAVRLAVDFTLECMQWTQKDPGRRTYGVNFEQALPMLVHRQEMYANQMTK